MTLETISSLAWLFIPLTAIFLFVVFFQPILRLFGVVFIGENENGIVNKKFVLFGNNKTLPTGSLIALNGEAGWQVDMLAPGVHFFFWPWQYEITKQKLTVIQSGTIATVAARDGKALIDGRVFGRTVDCNNFQDARAFLMKGGQRGPQLAVIPPGTYRINTFLFELEAQSATSIDDMHIGIVTTNDGIPLDEGHIAGPRVEGHNNFQDPDAFIARGGKKGLQEQVLLAGLYYINPYFATIEKKELTVVPIAHVGVIVSYVGEKGEDVSGDEFKHGNLVADGKRGVWKTPLDPGKYPINPFTHKIEPVSTANVVLNWADAKTESHKLDANLSTIKLRSKDGFMFPLDVSQIIHIPYNDAPKVIARFGTVQGLVTQVLEPIIGNYFRVSAQQSDVISFLQQRSQRQAEARSAISAALREYNVEAVDTLIGDIVPPADLMKTLTDREIAKQEKATFAVQLETQTGRKELEQARAIANTQSEVVQKERLAEMATFEKNAAVTQAQARAEARRIEAEANANAVKIEGAAEASKIQAVGQAEASVIDLKIKSMQSGNYASIEVAKHLANSKVPIVPSVVLGGGGNGGDAASSILSYLMASKLQEDLGESAEVKAA